MPSLTASLSKEAERQNKMIAVKLLEKYDQCIRCPNMKEIIAKNNKWFTVCCRTGHCVKEDLARKVDLDFTTEAM